MRQAQRERPKPWAIQETTRAFRIIDAERKLVAEIPFGSGCDRGLTKEAARQMADRMLKAEEVLTLGQASSGCEPKG